MQTAKVFITDGFWRKTLSAVRSLGRQAIDVTVGEHCRLAPAFFSKYCSRQIIYPSPYSAPDDFISFLVQELDNTHYNCLIPMEEETLLLISKNMEEIKKRTFILVPAYDKIMIARDKGAVVKHATKMGIVCPQTYFITQEDQVAQIADTARFPLVIKPRISSGSRGICYVSDKKDLVTKYSKVHQRYRFPLIQERIPDGGGSYCLSALFSEKSELKAAFVHKRLRQYPLTGGPSTLRESVYHERVKTLGIELLKSLDWVGVASVEFKMDPQSSHPILMEINPRFWGSLALAIYAGVDFPGLICRMAAGEEIELQDKYKTGKKARWLLPGDMMYFFSAIVRGRLQKDFFSFRDPDTTYDIVSADDPLPSIITVLSIFSMFFNRDMKRFMARR